MKIISIFITFLLTTFNTFSQLKSVELETYCFGNSSSELKKNLSYQAKEQLSLFLETNKVDTTEVRRIKFDEAFLVYTTENYLSNNSYKFLYWSKNGERIYTTYNSTVKDSINVRLDKLIILYNTDKVKYETLSFYLIE